MRRFREWRLRRAELALADLKDHADRWGWSYKPSEWDQYDRAKAKLKRRIARLAPAPVSQEVERDG